MHSIIFSLLIGLTTVSLAHSDVQKEPLGIIFDCDGTLIDSEYLHYLSWRSALKKRGVEITEEEYGQFAGHTGQYIAQKFYEMFVIDSAEALHRDKKQIYLRLHQQGVPSIDRTIRFVQKLAKLRQELGIKLAIASSAPKQEILVNLKRLELEDVFDTIVSGKDDLLHYNDPEGVNKPKPYIYLHAAQLLGLSPSRCVALEDSGPGVQAAARAGLITFAVPNTFTKGQDFSEATYIVAPHVEFDLNDFFEKIGILR